MDFSGYIPCEWDGEYRVGNIVVCKVGEAFETCNETIF